MKIEFRLTDDEGRTYQGVAQLTLVDSERDHGGVQASTAVPADIKGLPGHILALRDAGYFREPRAPNEVHAELLQKYHCLLDRVQMALLRLQRRRELRKAVKNVGGEDLMAYVW